MSRSATTRSMRSTVFAVLGAAWVVALATCPTFATAQYHDPVYIGGGGSSTSSLYQNGIVKYDAKSGTLSTLVDPGVLCYGYAMDVDNRCLVFAASTASSLTGGLFRYDPATNGISTIYSYADTLARPYKFTINADGEYVVGTRATVFEGQTPRVVDQLMKFDAAGTASTIWTTTQLGRAAVLNGVVQMNPDTGNYLVCDGYSSTSTLTRYPVLDIGDDGSMFVWSTGGRYGWNGVYDAPFDLRTGELLGIASRRILRLTPGTDRRTTVGILNGFPTTDNIRQSRFDLQSAAAPRWVSFGYATNRTAPAPFESYICYVDRQTHTVTSISLTPKFMVTDYDFVFWRGRHVQTVRTAPRQWDVRLSVPAFPGKPYALAMTAFGTRPGVSLPDGRTILINPDTFTFLTLGNLIRPVFDPGPLVLDQNGEATGRLDMSLLPTFGWPFWLQLVVLDPAAPGGIAYIPDPYVIRL